MDVLALLDSIDDVDAPTKKRRSTLVLRERRPFATYMRPMLQDRTFSMRFRMGYDDFMALVDPVCWSGGGLDIFRGILLCVLARVFSCVSRERWRYQCCDWMFGTLGGADRMNFE